MDERSRLVGNVALIFGTAALLLVVFPFEDEPELEIGTCVVAADEEEREVDFSVDTRSVEGLTVFRSFVVVSPSSLPELVVDGFDVSSL